jgi:hypothetical protein
MKGNVDLVEEIVNGIGARLGEPDTYGISILCLTQTPDVFSRKGEFGFGKTGGCGHFELALFMVEELSIGELELASSVNDGRRRCFCESSLALASAGGLGGIGAL